MKKLLCSTLLFTTLIGAKGASAGTQIEAKAWSKVQAFEARTLAPVLEKHLRELVEIKFTFRDKDIHHLKPNWYESYLWQPDPKARKGFSNVRVMIAKKDLEAFKTITTDASSGAEITVYGRVLRDFDAHFLFVQLYGRNTVVDPGGNATISW